MDGDTSTLSVTFAPSAAKAALGAVSDCEAEVTHGEAPVPEAELDHPAGKDGAATPSKFSENVTLEFSAPMGMMNLLVLTFEPSWERKEAIIFPPHWPLAVNVNGRETS